VFLSSGMDSSRMYLDPSVGSVMSINLKRVLFRLNM
jgi:hypothetical protein